MNSQQWIEKSDKYIMKTYGRYPIVPVRGEGCRLWDADGKEYLDFLGGVAVNNLGHCHPAVVAALQKQAAELIHCSNYYQIPQQIELAELLCSHSFADKAFFCNSGAEANEAAIKLARKYSRDKFGPDRYEIITAADSFHGRTMATVSATGQEKVQRFFDPLLHGFTPCAVQRCCRPGGGRHASTCAVMLEPIQGEGGVNVPSPGYFQEVRQHLRPARAAPDLRRGAGGHGAYRQALRLRTLRRAPRHHDPGQGPGRRGAHRHHAGQGRVCRRLRSRHPRLHLRRQSPGDCAAAVATVRTILEEGILNRTEEIGEYLLGELETLGRKYPFVNEVRGIGLMIGMSLTIPGADIVKKGHEPRPAAQRDPRHGAPLRAAADCHQAGDR